MVIEWGVLGGAIPWVGEWATVAVATAIVKGMKGQFSPDEMTKILKRSTEAAEGSQSGGGGLFSGCDWKAPKGAKKFLEQFFQMGEVLKELQKPLQDAGQPSVEILVVAFEVAATQKNSGVEAYKSAMLRSWMEVFVGCYVGEVQGICLRVAKDHYLKQLAHRVDDVKFVGIAASGEETQKALAKIFVMPDVREEKRSSASDPVFVVEGNLKALALKAEIGQEAFVFSTDNSQRNLLEEQRSWASRDRSGPKIPAQKVLTQSKNKAVLLGAPGSGKTTLASYFALMLCEQAGNDPTQIGLEADWLPVVIRIRDWVLKPELSVLKYLRWYAEDSLSVKVLPIGFFEHWLERGRALILLDGLDEVVDEGQRRTIVEQIETFLGLYEDCPAVITSRPAGYRWDFFNVEAFPHYTLEPFDDKQVDTFIDHWYDSRELDKGLAKRRKEDLRSAFKGNDRIRQLATNPLLLTIIALIHRYQAELPRRRFKLYESAVETLLTSWDSGKDIKLYSVLQQLKSDDLLYVLKKLAYWIHTQGSAGETDGGTLIETDELMRQLQKEIKAQKKCESHEAKAEAKRFVDFIQRRTGLLNEQGKDRYAFVHKTFQEYLTAEEIYDRFEEGEDEAIVDHIQAHLHDPHWREVLLLLVSKLKKKRAARAIEVILNAGSEYEKWLHRDLLFAGWCLTEDPEGLKTVAEGLVGEILDGLVAIEISDTKRNGNKAREESAEIIKRLGGTVFEGNIWGRLNSEEGTIAQFRLLEFQAFLGQEGEAIETLLKLLKDDDSDVRVRAASALVELGNRSPEVVSESFSLFKNTSTWYRSESVLIQLGSTSPEVISGLLNLLQDDDSDVCSSAAFVLSQLGNSSIEIIRTLLKLLNKNDDSVVLINAILALGQLGKSSPEVVGELLNLIQNDDSYVRSSVASALGQLGNALPEVVRGLLNLLQDDNSRVLSSTTEALVHLKSSSPEVLRELLNLVQNDDSHVRSSVASTLGQLGNTSPEVMKGLLSLLQDDDSPVRSRAASALVQLRSLSPELMRGLLSLLQDNTRYVRSRAVHTLGQLGKESIEVLPALVEWIDRQPDDVPIGSAIDALRSILE